MARSSKKTSGDLASASDLLICFSSPDESDSLPNQPIMPANPVESQEGGGLGDFSKLWEYMASDDYKHPFSVLSKDVPSLTNASSSCEDRSFTDRDTYASDGAAYKPPLKVLARGEDTSDTSENDVGPIDDSTLSSTAWGTRESARMERPKTSKKKKTTRTTRLLASSDVEFEKEVHFLKRSAPATKAGSHVTPSIVMQENSHHDNFRSRDQLSDIPSIPKKSEMKKIILKKASPAKTFPDSIETEPVVNSTTPTSDTRVIHELQQTLKKTFSGRRIPAHSSLITTPRFPRRPKPMAFNGHEKYERDIALRLFLIEKFPEQRQSLAQLVQFKDHNTFPNALHVFIDFSNIWVGFMMQIKLLVGVTSTGRLPDELRKLSFDSLAFLLERGRPVSRRVLVGSTPRIPAFEAAELVGYELNILDKVLKARDLHTWQKRELYHAHRNGIPEATQDTSTPGHIPQYNSSTGGPGIMAPSTTTAARSAAVLPTSFDKWVEQGVDEILQMKMMESVLDTAMPATIVLATGDGAEAEYSGGFVRAVERALRRGWTVELVSWSQGTSALYKKESWLAQWKPEQFLLIELDEFAEYLLEISGPAAV